MKENQKQYCAGCRQDYYNHANPQGVKECWHFKDAKIVAVYGIGWWVPQDKASNFFKTKKPTCYLSPGSTAYYRELPEHLRATSRRV